ncbi:MAG: DNA mismatch repair protein MutS [Vicinamibacteria bacterium]|nr:DNA mismatch repair protein MutS [Vicinamibacteria bacterium]
MEPLDPRAEHERRRDAHRVAAAAAQQVMDRLSLLRGAVFATAALLWALVTFRSGVPAWSVPAALGVFVALVALHARQRRRRDHARRATAHHEDRLARLDEAWEGRGDPGDDFLDPRHPFAEDLDLFGRGSLYERLSLPASPLGRAALARFLLQAAVPEAVRLRQRAVAELRPAVELREHLALLAAEGPRTTDTDALAVFAATARTPFPFALRAAASVVSTLALAGLVAVFGYEAPLSALVLPLLAVAAFTWSQQERVARVLAGAARAERLFALAAVAARIDREAFRAPRLASLRETLAGAGPALHALAWRLDLLESRRNPLFAPLAWMLVWDLHVAASLESWRARHGGRIGAWFDALGELEALLAVSAYAFENPRDPFPELCEDDGVLFEADGLAHPLIAEPVAIRNDVALGADRRALIVSGSNMSGKSTLLRSVGLAVVMAQAGAPVRARRLRLSPLKLGASMRVRDSVREGRSRFFAEIERLAQVLRLTEQGPALFLLDEVLSGTNSADRRAGASALVHGLLSRGAIGLLTTHDLALAEIAREGPALVENVHFEDHIEAGHITFDYKMRPGVVTRSNALALMRAVGLEVDQTAPARPPD